MGFKDGFRGGSGVFKKYVGFFSGVFQGCFIVVSGVFQGMFQMYFRDMSAVIQGCVWVFRVF